ncbi:MAG: DNA primase, partial [Acetivibrio sp.]
DKYSKTWEDHVSQDDMCSAVQMQKACDSYLLGRDRQIAEDSIKQAKKRVESLTAWRLEGTLREFPKFSPVNLWFDYPVHKIDDIGVLKDVGADGETAPWKKNFTKKKSPEQREKEKTKAIETAYEACGIDEKITIKSLAEYMGVNEKTIRRKLREHGGYEVKNGEVTKK